MKEQMTAAEYVAWQATQKPATKEKYGNVSRVVDGVTYKSTGEATYAGRQRFRKLAGEIKDYFVGVVFHIHGVSGESLMTYTPDFVILHLDDRWEVIDIKGGKKSITPTFSNKAKLILDEYGMEVICIDSRTWQPITYLRKRKAK